MYKRGGGKTKPFIQVTTTTTYETDEQINAFIKLLEPYCDYLNVGKTLLNHLEIDKMKLTDDEKEELILLREKENVCKCHLKICPEVFDKLSINWDGTVTACCSDYDNQMLVGNILEEDLKEIFTGKKVNYIRKLISEDNYNTIPICSQCFDLGLIETN